MTTEEIVSRLEGVKRAAGGWEARCPAHQDRHQSLSVKESLDGQTLIHCHAGCSIDAVCGALGIEKRDLFLEREPDTPEAVYSYFDETGRLLFEVVRFPGKQFRQRQIVNGEVVWNMKDVRRVPYHLGSFGGSQEIYITEGEKDADAIIRSGDVGEHCATTFPGGAGSWKDDYAQHFEGKDVTIVADNDEPGMKHARQVAKGLLGIARTVRIVKAKVGKDAFDHLAAGHTLAELEIVEEAMRPDGIVLRQASTVKPRAVDWLPGYENMLAFGALSSIMGMPGTNKSTWTCRVAAAVNKAGRGAIFVASEDSPEMTMRPRLEVAGANLDLVHFATVVRDGFEGQPQLPNDIDQIDKAMAMTEAGLLVIDPISAHYGGDVDNMNDSSVRKALSPLAHLAEKHRAIVLIAMHMNKNRSQSPMLRAGGSIGIPGISRTCMVMAAHPDGDDPMLRVVAGYKNNWGPLPSSVVYRLAPVPLPNLDNETTIKLEYFGLSSHKANQLLIDKNDHWGRGGDRE